MISATLKGLECTDMMVLWCWIEKITLKFGYEKRGIFNKIPFLHKQASKYLKIGTCPASQKILAYMGKNLIFTINTKIFTCPAAWATRKYERTSGIFEPW